MNEGTNDEFLVSEHEQYRGVAKVQASLSEEGTLSLIARAVKQHKEWVTSRGTQSPIEGPIQTLPSSIVQKGKLCFLGEQEKTKAVATNDSIR